MRDGSRAPRELAEVVIDAGSSIAARMDALKLLSASSEDEAQIICRNLLVQLSSDLGIEPELAYQVGIHLAQSLGHLEPAFVSTMSYEACLGWGDEMDRITAREQGVYVERWRQLPSETRTHIRLSRGGNYPLSTRMASAVALGDAAEEEEINAINTLLDLAEGPRVPGGLARSAGIGFARLRVRQGIYDSELTANFADEALQGYLEEADLIRTAPDG